MKVKKFHIHWNLFLIYFVSCVTVVTHLQVQVAALDTEHTLVIDIAIGYVWQPQAQSEPGHILILVCNHVLARSLEIS